MELQVAFLVVRFLEQDVGTDTCFLQLAVILHGGGRNIHIDAADRPVFVFDGINRFDAFQNVFDGIMERIFTGFQRKALMPHVLQRDDLPFYFFLVQLFTGNVLVDAVVRAVYAAVNAVIGKIQRGKKNNAVAVKRLLDFFRQFEHLFV